MSEVKLVAKICRKIQKNAMKILKIVQKTIEILCKICYYQIVTYKQAQIRR